jgi:hypothetical protein
VSGLVAIPAPGREPREWRYDTADLAAEKQASWKREFAIRAAMFYGTTVLIFFAILLLAEGYPPPAQAVEAAAVASAAGAGFFSLILFDLKRNRAVSTIVVNDAGIIPTTLVGDHQALRWDDAHFRLVLWNHGPPVAWLSYREGIVGVIHAPRGYLGWPTQAARDVLLRAAREHGVRSWTWYRWSLLAVFPSRTLLARRLSLMDRLRGLRADRPDS